MRPSLTFTTLRGMIPLGVILVSMIILSLGQISVGLSAAPPNSTFIVNNVGDYGDATPGDGLCITANGVCTLRAAVQEANALAGMDTIQFDPLYNGILISPTSPYTISAPVTITGNGITNTILDGGDQTRLIYVRPNISLEMEALTLMNGGEVVNDSSALYNNQGNVHLANIFMESSASGFIWNDSGILTITNSLMDDNHGPLNRAGLTNIDGTVTLQNSNITENSGGATILNQGGILSMQGGTIEENGGYATATIVTEEAGVTTIVGAVINRNTGVGIENTQQGGAFRNSGGSTLTIRNSTISNNLAHADYRSTSVGGGISNEASSELIVEGSTFLSNSARGGGAIANYGNATIANSTFTANTNAAIYAFAGTLRLIHVTLYENPSTSGVGGINTGLNAEPTEIYNTIVAHRDVQGADCGGAIFNGGGTLASDTTCSADFVADPLLGKLTNNGGNSPTHALLTGSPALDTAVETFCLQAPVNGIDQRGLPRAALNGCDIGAYEAQTLSPTVTPTSTVTATPSPSPTATPTATITLSTTPTREVGLYLPLIQYEYP